MKTQYEKRIKFLSSVLLTIHDNMDHVLMPELAQVRLTYSLAKYDSMWLFIGLF